MSVFEWLNVGLGLISIYLVTAISCTAATEGLSSLFGLRWKMLRDSISKLFESDDALKKFYDSPFIKPLFRGKQYPSVISAAHFSGYVFEQVFSSTKPDDIVTAQDILAKAQLGDAAKSRLLAVLGAAEDSLSSFRGRVEKWFDTTMESVSAWYKSRTRIISLIVAVAIAALGNIDTIAIARFLTTDAAARTAYATEAFNLAQTTGGDISKLTGEQRNTLQSLEAEYKLPLGWEGSLPTDPYSWALRVLGILLTGFAASLGAPFWFDVLTRVAELRKRASAADSGGGASSTSSSA